MTTGFKMVRIPDELAERITATGQKREPFVRQAIEAALERPSAGTEPTRPAAPRAPAPKAAEAAPSQADRGRSPSEGSSPAPAPPRAAATSAPVNYAMERQRKLNEGRDRRRS